MWHGGSVPWWVVLSGETARRMPLGETQHSQKRWNLVVDEDEAGPDTTSILLAESETLKGRLESLVLAPDRIELASSSPTWSPSKSSRAARGTPTGSSSGVPIVSGSAKGRASYLGGSLPGTPKNLSPAKQIAFAHGASTLESPPGGAGSPAPRRGSLGVSGSRGSITSRDKGSFKGMPQAVSVGSLEDRCLAGSPLDACAFHVLWCERRD